jgi:uncharacterized protein involved in exopolysaccharide biosynthesis
MGRLPEQMEASLQTLQRLQLELQGVDQNLETAEGRLERLIARAPSDSSAVPPLGTSEREALEAELARLRQRYTDEHPDVKALAARLRGLEPTPAPAQQPALDRSSIAAAQVERARADVNALLARRHSLREQISNYEGRVEQMPRKEQDLATLTRDFNQLRDNYQTLLRRKLDAQMAERLQQRWTEDFEILDRARLPEHHVFPNRVLFILAGVILGLGLGLGASLVVETLNRAVLSLEDLEATIRVPVLAVLPLIEPREAAEAMRALGARRLRPGNALLADHHS